VRLTRFESLRAFRYPAFVQIWIGAFISNLGSWIQSIAIGAVLMVQGGVYLWMLTALSTTCIGRVSREVQARMSSLNSMTLSGYSLGLLIQGWLGDRVGLRAVPVAALLFLLALSLHRRGAFAAVDAPSKFGGFLQRAAPASPERESRNSL
jgi:MFS family permease